MSGAIIYILAYYFVQSEIRRADSKMGASNIACVMCVYTHSLYVLI